MILLNCRVDFAILVWFIDIKSDDQSTIHLGDLANLRLGFRGIRSRDWRVRFAVHAWRRMGAKANRETFRQKTLIVPTLIEEKALSGAFFYARHNYKDYLLLKANLMRSIYANLSAPK